MFILTSLLAEWSQEEMTNYSQNHTTYIQPSENKDIEFIKTNFVKGWSNKIANILRKYDIRNNCIKSNNLGKNFN